MDNRGSPRSHKTKEAWKKVKNGEIERMDYQDILFQSHGFKDMADFNKSVRATVLKMIALKADYPYSVKGHSVQYQIDIIKKYQNIDVDLKCECCGEIKDIHFMTIDHTDNNGAKHKRDGGGRGSTITRDVLRYGFDSK